MIDERNSILSALGAALPGGETVVAAVSGGPDSMAMFHALCELAREREITVIATHFDHRLRQNSSVDCDLVELAARRYGVRAISGAGDVAGHALATRQSVEAAARELRYAFLESVAIETGAKLIATGHTRDDQVETVLMRILHGAGPRGRRGILARRGRVIRPLLSVRRAETRAYCRSRDLRFVDDPSNSNCRFERNRIRHQVLPGLRGAFPGIDDALLRIAAGAEIEFARAGALVEERLVNFLGPEIDGGWLLRVDAFTDLDRDDCSHLINAALEEMHARTDVTAMHHEMVLDLIAAESGTIAYIPGLRVRREHDGVIFERPDSVLPRREIARALAAPGTVDLDGWHMEAHRIGAPSEAQLSNSGSDVAYIPCNDTMIVRYPREGDRMQPFGMSGHKKLSDIFIDRKIPRRRRAITPVIEVDGEIVWVVGVATSERCRISADSHNVVQLSASRSYP